MDLDLIPVGGTKISQAAWYSQKKEKQVPIVDVYFLFFGFQKKQKLLLL